MDDWAGHMADVPVPGPGVQPLYLTKEEAETLLAGLVTLGPLDDYTVTTAVRKIWERDLGGQATTQRLGPLATALAEFIGSFRP
jgi:hypothetical protein